MNIVITGGAGFIGSNLASLALAGGHHVTVIDDLSTGFEDNLDGLDVRFMRASVLEERSLDDAMADADSVVHLAALGSVPRSIKNPFGSHAANATGTLAVLEAARARGVDHVICASSSSVYGLNPALPKHEREWVRPMSPYAVTKLATEQYTLAYQQSFGMQTLAFRLFNVYGPSQRAGHAYAAVIPTWIDAMLKGDPVWVNGDGSNSRDFTYVETVCEVLLRAVERRVSHPEPVNLAFGTNISLLELINRLTELSGLAPDVRHREPRAGDVPHSCADNATLLSLFPDVQAVPLNDGVQRTLEWFHRDLSFPIDSPPHLRAT